MMRKLTIIVIGILSLVTLVFAITLSNKEIAFAYWQSYTQEREDNIEKIVATITYTNNFSCSVPDINCGVCFNYLDEYDCLDHMPENLTEIEIDKMIDSYVREMIESDYHKEEIRYTVKIMEGRQLQIVQEVFHYCATEDNLTSDCYSISASRCYHNEEKKGWNTCVGGTWELV